MKKEPLIILLILCCLPINISSQVIANEAIRLNNTTGDLQMRRYSSNDLLWKRALVPFATQLMINYDGDFSGGVRIQGTKLLVDGFTGIGTTSPASLLEVRSPNNNRLRVNFNGTPSLSFVPNNGHTIFHIGHNLQNRLTFSAGTNVDNSNLLTIVNSGNVGIGTINPDAKLTVKGSIHTQEVKVDLNGSVAPDYVFKEGYALKGIHDLEAYIKENGHLPNIPSAKEMGEHGIHLKEMNLKLLEKIEELTLYVIELKKENSLIKPLQDELIHQKKEMEQLKELIENLK